MDLEKVMDLIRRHEGLRLTMYKCPAGKLTIGYGHNLETTPITTTAAEWILMDDIFVVEQALSKALPELWLNLGEVRKAALVDMGFNLGIVGLLKFKKMLAAMQGGDFSEAAREAKDSKWYTQVGQRGERIVAMIETGQWQ